MTNQPQPNGRPNNQANPAVFYALLFIAVFIVTFAGLDMLLPPSAISTLHQLGPAKALLGYVAAVVVAGLVTAVVRWLLRPKRKGQPDAQADLSETT